MLNHRQHTLTSIFGRCLIAVCITALLPLTVHAQQRGFAISIDSIRIEDEDDPGSNDEPYLIVTKVRGRVQLSGGTPSIVPDTLQVTNVMSGHNDLGRRSDNWADEVRTYAISERTPRIAQELLPDEPGWFVAAVIVHLEEDGFAPSTARVLSDEVRRVVETATSGMSLARVDTSSVYQVISQKILRDLRSSLSGRGGSLFRVLTSVVDPDDVGGAQIVFAGSNPLTGNIVSDTQVLSSSTTPVVGLIGTPLADANPYSLRFPTATDDIRRLPGNARFQGRHKVNVTARTWIQSELY